MFHEELRQTGSFSVTDPFLTTFYVEKLNEILRNRGKDFEKSYVPLHGGRGVRNCQNHPYVRQMTGDLCTAPSIISLPPLSLASDVTNATLGAFGKKPGQELVAPPH